MNARESWTQRLKRRVARTSSQGPSAFGRGERPQALSLESSSPSGFATLGAVVRDPAFLEVIRLAWPIAAAMLGETATGLVDTKLVGGLGASALGGVGIALTFMYLCYALVYGTMRGVKVRAAYAIGRGDPRSAQRYGVAGLVLGAGFGAVVWIFGRDITWALELLGFESSLVPYARDFFAARTSLAPITCMMTALIQHRQGLGDSRGAMVPELLGNVLNGVLAYALIYGHFGLPALGVRGAGYGTAIAELFIFLLLLGLYVRDERKAGASGESPTLTRRTAVHEVVTLGLPTGLQFGAEIAAFMTFTTVLGRIGGAEIAAHQIGLAVIRTSFLPGIAVAEAASILVGRSLGARSLRDADRYTRAAVVVAVGFMAMCGVVFAVFGRSIAHAFTDDENVAGIATRLLVVAALFQVLDAVNIVYRGALRGAKDVRAAAVIGIGVVWFCIPTAAYVFGKLLGMGALGGWLGFVAETTISSWLFYRRWKTGAWRTAFLVEETLVSAGGGAETASPATQATDAAAASAGASAIS
ncbi:MAG: MATE family efflux transporter [Polyangiaceae bacterium]